MIQGVKMAQYIGVMSGTSMDSIDVALCEIDGITCKLLASLEYPFDKRLKSELLALIEKGTTLQLLGTLDHRLGMLFGDAVNALLDQSGVSASQIESIGLHGQTLWHQPEGSDPFTLQLGDPNVLVQRCGIRVVADFRRADMARGGQGAPFTPVFHAFLFGKNSKKRAVLNIGGIANITLLQEPLVGYDIGPGNVLMDSWIALALGKAYDAQGAWAASGHVDDALLERFLQDPYFRVPPPKSTGREYFNKAWLQAHLGGLHVSHQDVQATLLELSARTIADAVQDAGVKELILCGGGAKNSVLCARLEALLPDVLVITSDSLGVSGDFMEAMAFAWLAHERIHGHSVPLASVTGAQSDGVLGGIYG
jgi:anhydro-N-acetylmuramic acid kinase